MDNTEYQGYAPPSQYSPSQYSYGPAVRSRESGYSMDKSPPPGRRSADGPQVPYDPSSDPRSNTSRAVDPVAVLDHPFSFVNVDLPQPELQLKVKPHWSVFSSNTVANNLAKLLTMDATVELVSNTLGAAGATSVQDDSRWLEQFSQLPLLTSNGNNNYVYVPDDTVIRQDEKIVNWVHDRHGPTTGSVPYPWWTNHDSDIDSVYSSGETWMTLKSLELFERRFNASQVDLFNRNCGTTPSFLLPEENRRKLYYALFHPIMFDSSLEHHKPEEAGYVDDIMMSKAYTIFRIEGFLLEVSRLFTDGFGLSKCPILTSYLDDFYDILNDLLKVRISVQDIRKELRFDQVTRWSESDTIKARWATRWTGIGLTEENFELITSPRTRRDYICGVLDAMFGLWPAPGHCLLHLGWNHKNGKEEIHAFKSEQDHWISAQAAVPRCIHTGLYFWESLPPQFDVGNGTVDDIEKAASISLRALDALLIQNRLPYKFKKTNHLEEHLTLALNEERHTILIYPHWKVFLMLRHHKLLVDDSRTDYPQDKISRFQLLSRSKRSPSNRIRGIGGDVRYLAYELIHTYALLFYRGVSKKGQYYEKELSVIKGDYYDSSEKIGQSLGIDFSGSEEFRQLLNEFSGPDYSSPQSSDFPIFGKRLVALNRELCLWKPSTLCEFWRWRGWIEEESAYWSVMFAIVFGLFAIISCVLSSVQIYYAVHPS